MAGRKAHDPTDKSRQQVKALSGYGLPQDQIADTVGISESTLKKYYGDELRRGIAVANATVGEALHKQCRRGNTTALIFWAKTRMGWKERSIHEIGGIDGQPLTTALEINFTDSPGSHEGKG